MKIDAVLNLFLAFMVAMGGSVSADAVGQTFGDAIDNGSIVAPAEFPDEIIAQYEDENISSNEFFELMTGYDDPKEFVRSLDPGAMLQDAMRDLAVDSAVYTPIWWSALTNNADGVLTPTTVNPSRIVMNDGSYVDVIFNYNRDVPELDHQCASFYVIYYDSYGNQIKSLWTTGTNVYDNNWTDGLKLYIADDGRVAIDYTGYDYIGVDENNKRLYTIGNKTWYSTYPITHYGAPSTDYTQETETADPTIGNVTVDGTAYPINPDGSVTINGTTYYPNEDGTYSIGGTKYAPSIDLTKYSPEALANILSETLTNVGALDAPNDYTGFLQRIWAALTGVKTAVLGIPDSIIDAFAIDPSIAIPLFESNLESLKTKVGYNTLVSNVDTITTSVFGERVFTDDGTVAITPVFHDGDGIEMERPHLYFTLFNVQYDLFARLDLFDDSINTFRTLVAMFINIADIWMIFHAGPAVIMSCAEITGLKSIMPVTNINQNVKTKID